jgi:hypothetical protein
MKHSNIVRLERIENRRNLNGPLHEMNDDDLLTVLQQSIRESGGTAAAIAEARADRDEALALMVEAADDCKSGAKMMARFEELLQAGRFEGATWK